MSEGHGMNILIGIKPAVALELAHQQMDTVAEKGGLDAACMDLEIHFKRKLTEDERKVVRMSMTLGMCMSYVILGQNLAAVDSDMRKRGIDPVALGRRLCEEAESGIDSDLKSTEGEHEAERETNSLLSRVSKRTLH